jgi:hypothetical protein
MGQLPLLVSPVSSLTHPGGACDRFVVAAGDFDASTFGRAPSGQFFSEIALDARTAVMEEDDAVAEPAGRTLLCLAIPSISNWTTEVAIDM